MERLISSPSSLRTPLLGPRLAVPQSPAATARSGLQPLSRAGLKPAGLVAGHHQVLPRCSSSSSPGNNVTFAPLGKEKKTEDYPSAQLAAGRESVNPLVQKVAFAAKLALLSASIVTVSLPILAPQPAYASLQSLASNTGRRLIRTEFLSSAWTGFLAGCLHTLSGPDHLAALAPLSIGRTKMESAAVGALWGCGHDAGQVMFGLLFLLLKDRLHIEVLRTWGTIIVGLTLLVIGAIGIKEALEVPTPCVALQNGDCNVGIIEPLGIVAGGKKKIGFATFATGIVHGLQPDALLMVLPALALPSRVAGAAFLGMFLVGTVVSMGSYTAFLSSCTQALRARVPRITERLTWAASLVAISMGVAILISQFFGFNLY